MLNSAQYTATIYVLFEGSKHDMGGGGLYKILDYSSDWHHDISLASSYEKKRSHPRICNEEYLRKKGGKKKNFAACIYRRRFL